MVDNAAALPEAAGAKRQPKRHHKKKHPEPHPRGHPAANPPSIDIQAASSTVSPVEEQPADVSSNAHAVYSTGQGGAEMYHYDRQPMTTQEQTANTLGQAEVAQVKGPGQA